MHAHTRLEPRESVHARQFQEELVLLDLLAGEYFALDALGARVWSELCRGAALGDIVAKHAGEYEVDPSRMTQDVFAFAEELVRRGLMTERNMKDTCPSP
jgi:hypothetical protein